MKITILVIALIMGFATAALAQPDPHWERCQYSNPSTSTTYCG